MNFSITPLLEEILQGSSRAIISILIIIILVLLYVIKTIRTENKDLQDKMEKQRAEFITLVDSMQKQFLDKCESMLDKYHGALNSQHENTEKIRGIVTNLINFVNSKEK